MKTITAVVILVLATCGITARAQLADDSLGARRNLANAGYRYDDTASLLRALSDENETVAVFATTFLAQQRATPEVISALRAASDGPRGSVALGAFDALQTLGVTGWEGSAIGLMYQTKTLQYSLAGVLARAGRSEGWWIVRDALTPDNVAMGVALNNTAPFHRLKSADGTTIDAVSELKRLQRDLRQRGRSAEASEIDLHVFEADKWGRRQRGPAR